MSDALRVLTAFFAVVNPASVALVAGAIRFPDERTRRAAIAIATVFAGGLAALAAVAADAILDGLEIEPETFRIAAGAVMATAGVYAALRPGALTPAGQGSRADGLFPLGIPTLLSPAMLVAAMSYGADEGVGTAIGAALVVFVLAAATAIALPAGRAPKLAADGIARLTGALLVVLSVALIVDGVLAV